VTVEPITERVGRTRGRYAQLIAYARRNAMAVFVRTRTSADLTQFEVYLSARSLDGAGGRPFYQERFPIDIPFMDAVDFLADYALGHFEVAERCSGGINPPG
jgi:hypothetical protein